VRIALQLQPEHATYPTIRSTAARAEDLGVDIIFNWDHFFPLTGDPDGAHFECWTVLAAWAESTSNVEVGPLVSCNAYRSPDLLADMARTVDHISSGRLILGIGSGWFERDFTEYRYDFGTAQSRIDNLAEALPRIRSRLARLNPAPVRRIPVLIGGAGRRRTLPLVARYADIWHSFADPVTIERNLSLLRRYCAEVGRDPAAIEVATGVTGGPSFVGPPHTLGPRLRRIGVSLFTVGVGGPDCDLGPLGEWIAWRDRVNGR
jgi:probable F420-dependent oxidoreductase